MRADIFRHLFSIASAADGRCAASLCCPTPYRMPVCIDARALPRRTEAFPAPRVSDVPLVAGVLSLARLLRRRIPGLFSSFALIVVVTGFIVAGLFAVNAVLPSPASSPSALRATSPVLATIGFAAPGVGSSDSAREREIGTRANQILAEIESREIGRKSSSGASLPAQ